MAPPLSTGNRISAGGAKRARFTCIPDELVGEILLRVPVKSVIRFKSVCKAWLCLLNSRSFIRSYGRRESRFEFKLSSLHCGGTRKADLYKLAPRLRIPTTGTGTGIDDCIFLQVLGPLSNGIYCITSRAYHKPSGAFSVLTAQIALCNPATYALKFANPFPPEFHELLSTAETKGGNIHFGFGIGNGGDSDYRVVVLLNYGEPAFASFLSFVYGVQRGEWRKIVDYEEGVRNLGQKKATDAFNGAQGRRMIEITPCMEACSQRLLHGCWHWVAIASEDVLSFHFADEAFRVIRGPPPPDIMADIGGRERIIQLCAPLVLRDRLAVIRSFRTNAPMTVEIDVWVMMEYGVQASWTRIYKTNPNVSIKLWRLCGMVHHQQQTGGPGIRIQRLFFKTTNLDIISFDAAAGYTFHNLPSTSKIVHWNTPGVSSYIETLEHL